MTRWAALALAAAALLPVTAVTAAEPIQNDEIGVLNLFDEFVSSGAAASQCAQPDDTEAARFLSNFQWVSSHATAEIGRQMAGSNAVEVAAELARRSKDVKDKTHAMVKAQGCDAEPVRVLVRRFAAQASWKRAG